MENKNLFVVAEKKEMNDDEMSIICYASTETVDRHGEMILSSAWTDKGLEDYRKNPVILLNHDYYSLPVGKSLWQKVDDKGLMFKIQFADTGYISGQLTVFYNGCEGSTYTLDSFVYVKGPAGNYKPSINCDEPYKYYFLNGSIYC